jgi:hypothetical protein
VIRHTNRYIQTDPQDFTFGSPTFGFVAPPSRGATALPSLVR